MKKLILLLTTVMCAVAQASTITFTGEIDSVNIGSPFQVGDKFIAKFSYSPQTGLVNRATITVEDQMFRYRADGTRIVYDTNACHGSVLWQATDSSYVDITLQAATPDTIPPNCNVIPPLASFNLNDFAFMFNTFGHLTAIPTIRP